MLNYCSWDVSGKKPLVNSYDFKVCGGFSDFKMCICASVSDENCMSMGSRLVTMHLRSFKYGLVKIRIKNITKLVQISFFPQYTAIISHNGSDHIYESFIRKVIYIFFY